MFSFPQPSPSKFCMLSPPPPVRATFAAQPILLDLTTPIILVKGYKSWALRNKTVNNYHASDTGVLVRNIYRVLVETYDNSAY
jgi:hypothetical protein